MQNLTADETFVILKYGSKVSATVHWWGRDAKTEEEQRELNVVMKWNEEPPESFMAEVTNLLYGPVKNKDTS